MKRLQALGLGSKRRQAEPLTLEEEEILWSSGLLGSSTPQALLDTMVYMNGLYFTLRSGAEHRQLRYDPCQIEFLEREGERANLKYTEDISKNKPEGLKGRKAKPKVVLHHANQENLSRCFVRLFKLYNSVCPRDRPRNVFYLQPLKKPTDECWFLNKPVGHTTLDCTVARLCKNAGIPGFQTNHSLRATAATRLYEASVDEQLIMERTGHQSLEGVRSYKRTLKEQQEELSDILNGTEETSSVRVHVPADATSLTGSTSGPVINTGSITHTSNSLTNNVTHTPPAFNFHSCSVTINYLNQQPQ